jgi:hypothetical protein
MAGLAMVVGVAQAQEPEPESETDIRTSTDCADCHQGHVTSWEGSAHGQAVTDPAFLAAWQAQGSPNECLSCHTTGFDQSTGTWEADGITCDACHTMPANSSSHPEQVMGTDSSGRFCGTCHVDTHAEWEISEHGANEMSCVRCHNPHTTEMRVSEVQQLCQNCHTEESHFYSFTGHAEQGLLCTDCHLRVSDSTPGEGHGKRSHTFAVDLETCSKCHDAEMHAPAEPMSAGTSAEPVIMGAAATISEAKPANLAEQPGRVSPFSLAAMAGVGLVFGIVVAPWIERWYRKSSRRDR